MAMDNALDHATAEASVSLKAVRGGLRRFVTEWLGQAIATGELVEGQQIVPEELGREFDVSRTVMRESLRVLTEKGMVTASPRSGTRVTGIDQWSLLDPDVIKWRVNGPQRDEQLRELVSLRFGVEPLAARGAAEAADADDVAELRRCCAEMERAAADGDLDSFTRADVAFHTRVLSSSGNLIYRQFARAIEAVLMARKDLDMLPPKLESVVVAHHRSIAEAIAAGDGARAETLTQELIGTAQEEIFAEVERRRTSAEGRA